MGGMRLDQMLASHKHMKPIPADVVANHDALPQTIQDRWMLAQVCHELLSQRALDLMASGSLDNKRQDKREEVSDRRP